jgi:hypothetical protein
MLAGSNHASADEQRRTPAHSSLLPGSEGMLARKLFGVRGRAKRRRRLG